MKKSDHHETYNNLTFDKESTPDPPASFHTTEQIGIKRSLTPEGFLLCQDVPIARTGWMIYMPGEVPVKPGPDGYIMINRDAETLFDSTCLASFNGKPVTDDHPQNGVDPGNWSSVAVGTTHNVRQGTGNDSDVMLADLLITDADAIRAVQSGKREVSAGYDATYETTGLGEGRQLNIFGNHIALVERGRCGPRCAIGDHQSPQLKRKAKMATITQSKGPKRRAVVSPLLRKLMLDAQAADAAINENDPEDDEGDSDENHVHVHLHGATNVPITAASEDEEKVEDPTEARFKKIEDSLTKMSDAMSELSAAIKKPDVTEDDDTEKEEEDEEGKGKTGDSAALESSFRSMMADAEVIVPGFALPTFDSKAKRKVTVDSMCSVRRKVLDTAYTTNDGRTMLNTLRGSTTLDTSGMACVEVAQLFRNAAGTKRLLNNSASTGDNAGKLPVAKAAAPGVMTIAELNKMHREHFKH